MSDGKPASILTDSQREYLKGENEPSNQREYDRRIRNRIEAAMSDFALLFEHMDEEEINKTFGSGFAPKIDLKDEAQGDMPQAPSTGANSLFAIAFLLRGLNYGNEPISPVVEQAGKQQPAFNHFIENAEFGIKLYLREYQDLLTNPDVSIGLGDLDHTDEFLSDLPDSDD